MVICTVGRMRACFRDKSNDNSQQKSGFDLIFYVPNKPRVILTICLRYLINLSVYGVVGREITVQLLCSTVVTVLVVLMCVGHGRLLPRFLTFAALK